MADVWTHGAWTVRPGPEGDFVPGRRSPARRASAGLEVASRPTLLRDRDRPSVFVSLGPRPSTEDVRRFRKSAASRETTAALEDLLEGFESRTSDEVGPDG
jgi:hypothetical protein